MDDEKQSALISFVDSALEQGRQTARLLRVMMDGLLPRTLSQRFHSLMLLGINLRRQPVSGGTLHWMSS